MFCSARRSSVRVPPIHGSRGGRKVLTLLNRKTGVADGLMTAARRLIFLKGTDAHDYKFSSAALEDYYHASPTWRARFLASSVYWLKGSGDKDNNLVKRARAALS